MIIWGNAATEPQLPGSDPDTTTGVGLEQNDRFGPRSRLSVEGESTSGVRNKVTTLVSSEKPTRPELG